MLPNKPGEDANCQSTDQEFKNDLFFPLEDWLAGRRSMACLTRRDLSLDTSQRPQILKVRTLISILELNDACSSHIVRVRRHKAIKIV